MKTLPLTKIRTFGMASAIAILLASPLAHAQVVADFTGGNGTASVDQYQGIAGDGWLNAWGVNTTGTSGGTSFVPTVTNTSPLNGGGNYLSTTLTAGSGSSKGTVQRIVDGTSFDLASPYTVSFDIRLDTAFTTFTADTDYLQIFDRINPDSSDFGGNGAWLIRAAGASVNTITARNWMYYNGGKNAAGYNPANFVDSGVALVPGTVYSFLIAVDPVNLEYTVSINGGLASAAMGFRNNTAANLGGLMFGGQTSGTGETITFSVDNIAVVPEPSVTALGIVAGVAVLTVLRRRKNRA